MDESQYVNNTDVIRKLKHSTLIKKDINKLFSIKKNNLGLWNDDPAQFLELAHNECPFLYNNYMELFHKFIKDELDLTIMNKLLIVLKLIEDGAVDQYNGSVMVGKTLKELYIDSAVRCGDNLDKKYESEKPVLKDGQAISWKQYKKLN